MYNSNYLFGVLGHVTSQTIYLEQLGNVGSNTHLIQLSQLFL